MVWTQEDAMNAEDHYIASRQPGWREEAQREAYEARTGADRMAAGLGCLPDAVRGDLDEVLKLRGIIRNLREIIWNHHSSEIMTPDICPICTAKEFKWVLDEADKSAKTQRTLSRLLVNRMEDELHSLYKFEAFA